MDIILNFDDLNPVLDIELNTQYSSRGVAFSPPLPLIFAPGAGGSTHFLVKSVFAGGSLNDRSSHQITGTFTSSRHSLVRVKVGRSENGFEAVVKFSAYDVSRNIVGATTIIIPATTAFTFGEILVSNPNISFFVLERTGNATADFFMSFLEFDDSNVPQRPDFRLVYSGPDLFLKPGAFVSLEVKVLRLFGSNGNISITADGGPPGLAITSVAPSVVNVSNGDMTTINFIIDANAREAQPSPITVLNVTGFPDITAGPTDFTLEISINILESYDLQIIGMEITQGIQEFDLPAKISPDISGGVTYDGVSLAANCRTTVRVFPSFRTLPTGPLPPSFGVRLNGFSANGTPLPGSTLFPEQLPFVLFGGNTVTPPVRVLSGTRFTLPPNWTQGTINLEAEIFDTSGSNSTSPALTFEVNSNNNGFSTNGIRFFKTESLFVRPIPLSINDVTQPGSGAASLLAPLSVFSAVIKLFPIDATKLVILPYQATLNVTAAFLSSTSAGTRATAILNAVLDFADSNGWIESQRSFTAGVYSAQFFGNFPTRVQGQTGPTFPPRSGILTHFSELASVVQDSGRPLTSVAHELSHLCGRVHASAASAATGVLLPTGAQAPFEPWPPDQLGFLQGVGFDTATNNVIYPQRFQHSETAAFKQFFDFMSYSANANDTDSWLSPRGSEETLKFLRPYSETHPDEPQSLLSSKATMMPLAALVRFRVDNETQQPTIAKVGPVENHSSRPGTELSYDVVIKAQNHKDIIARGHPFSYGRSHHHESSILQATLPITSWDTVGSVEIHRDSTLILHHIRPAHSATIADLTVTSSPPNRTISWTTTHPQSLPLSAQISYRNPSHPASSPAAWKHIYSCPHLSSQPSPLTHTTGPLPASHFPHNPSAQNRLTLSDGFNVTTALSAPFASAGSPPEVHILSPRVGERLLKGCTVYLHVEAYDDWGEKIVDEEKVRWKVGGEIIARGPLAAWVSGGEGGKSTVRVEAEDYLGRREEREVGVEFSLGG